MDGHKRLRHLFGLEGRAASAAPGAERAVVAVTLASRGEQGFEECDLLSPGKDGPGDELVSGFSSDLRAVCVFCGLQVHLRGEKLQPLDSVHAFIIEQVF
jgi:hypothetical protein